jgi:hypothetical protein
MPTANGWIKSIPLSPERDIDGCCFAGCRERRPGRIPPTSVSSGGEIPAVRAVSIKQGLTILTFLPSQSVDIEVQRCFGRAVEARGLPRPRRVRQNDRHAVP